MKLRTIKHNEFYSKLPRYIFVKEDADINPETDLPYSEDEWCKVDCFSSFHKIEV